MEPHIQEHKQYYRTLTRNMLFTVVIVSFLPMIFVGGIILYQFQESYSEKVTDNLENIVNRHRKKIDIFLEERQDDISFIGSRFGYEQLSDEFFLQEMLASLQKENENVFSDLGIVDHQGRQIAYAGPFKLEKAIYSDAEWFKKAISSQTFISDVFLGLRGFPHFIVTVRNFNAGKPWILRATVDFQAFSVLVQNIRIGKTGGAFIINRKGEYQTTSTLDIAIAKQLYNDLEASANPDNEVQTGIRMNSDNNDNKMIYVAGFLKNREWALIYTQDSRDAFEDLIRAEWYAFLVFVIGGIIIITMAMWVSRNMVNRIAEADRGKEMMNQQVIESGRLASLGEMAAGIAHEINNPVAIMVEEAGWIGDILEEEEFEASENREELQRALDQIKKQGLRCRDITHKLLSFARRSDSRPQIVEINAMIEEVIGLFSHQAKFRNVAIYAQYAKELPHIRASQTEMEQVIFNLINNAMDAMRDSGGRIDITSAYEGDMVVVEVKDNGPGIPRSDLSKIFDPFFTTKPVGEGTGLGLSICYGILNKIGGKITVSSAVGVGTTFRVYLPWQKPDMKEQAAKKEKNDSEKLHLN